MYKLKSNRSASKRFSSTKKGKVKAKKAFGSHLLTHKNAARKRRLKTPIFLESGDKKKIKRLLPYL